MNQENTDNPHQEIERARALLEEGRHDTCLEVIRAYWLENPQDIQAIDLMQKLMTEADQKEIAGCLESLKRLKAEDNENLAMFEKSPEKVFEAGYKMIDLREYGLAEMLLKFCATFAPDDPSVHYELAFSMMSQAKYELAARHFELVRKIEEDFDTVLNLSACYTLASNFKRSKEMLKQLKKLATTDEEKYELNHRRMVLKRQEQLKKKTDLTPRDWLYILYGSMLLFDDYRATNNDSRQTESFIQIAKSLMVLKGVLEGLRLAPEAIEFYSPTSRPLSSILATLFDVPLSAYKGPDRPDHALMIMDWAPEIIGPHKSFVHNRSNRSIFSYGLPSNMPLPLIPEVIAHFSDTILLPWSGESQGTLNEGEGEGELTPEEAIPEILEKAFNLESDPDVLKIIHDAISYYVDKRELLVLANSEGFPHRPEYSAEVPSLETGAK